MGHWGGGKPVIYTQPLPEIIIFNIIRKKYEDYFSEV